MTSGATSGREIDAASIRRALVLARTLAAVLALVGAAEARADRLRVLVLVAGDEQRELAARVRGQTADLDAAVATADTALPGDLDGQLAVARAARDRADVVVWFRGDPGGDWTAYVLRHERVLVRRVAGASGALSRSASQEAVALTVRTALAGLAASAEPEPEEPAVVAERPALRPWGELGGTGALDGTRSSGRYGATVSGGVARGRWHAGAMAGYQPQAAMDATSASIAVERLQAGAVVGGDLVVWPGERGPRWTLALELGLGAARIQRVTKSAGSGLVATPSAATWSPLLAPGVRLARRVGSGAWLAVEAGADVLTHPPEYGVQRAAGFDRLGSVWAFQPRASLSVLLDWR